MQSSVKVLNITLNKESQRGAYNDRMYFWVNTGRWAYNRGAYKRQFTVCHLRKQQDYLDSISCFLKKEAGFDYCAVLFL